MSNTYFRTSDNCKIHYQLEGKGSRMLLFLHGMGCSAGIWNEYVKYFTPFFQTLRLDLRGCGQSEYGGAALSLFRLSEDIRELLEHLEVSKSTEINIMAHSMGAQVAFIFNERRVHPLKRIIAIAASGIEGYKPDEVMWLHQMMEQQKENRLPFQFSNPWLQNLQLPMAYSNMTSAWLNENRIHYQETLLEYTKAMLAEPSASFWNQSGIPIHLIFGSNDRLIPNPLFRKMGTEAFIRSQIGEDSAITCSFIDHAGHFVLLEKKAKVIQQCDANLM